MLVEAKVYALMNRVVSLTHGSQLQPTPKISPLLLTHQMNGLEKPYASKPPHKVD